MIVLSKDEAYTPEELVSNLICATMDNRKLNLTMLTRRNSLPVNFSLTELMNKLIQKGLSEYFLPFKSHVINLYYLYQQLVSEKISGPFIRRYFKERGLSISRDQAQCISSKLKCIKKEKHNTFVSVKINEKITGSDINK
ncbi:MAG: hypothetical protein ACRCX5_15105 [Bacteroidales bacterium]